MECHSRCGLRSICEEHHTVSSGYDARNLVSRAAGRSGWKCKVCTLLTRYSWSCRPGSTIKCEVSHVSAVACIRRSRADRLGVREGCHRFAGSSRNQSDNRLAKHAAVTSFSFFINGVRGGKLTCREHLQRQRPLSGQCTVQYTIFGVDPCN